MDGNEFRGRGLRASPFFKFIVFLLSVALGTGAVLGWVYCGQNWDVLFDEGDFTCTNAWTAAMGSACSDLDLRLSQEWDVIQNGSMDYMEQKSFTALLDRLAPENTNFRYTVRDNATGELLFSSCGENSLEGAIDVRASLRSFTVYSPSGESSGTYYQWNTDGYYEWYDGEDTFLGISSSLDIRPPEAVAPDEVATALWAVEYGVDGSFPVEDAFFRAKQTFTRGNLTFFYLTGAATLLWLGATALLMCCAGRRKGCADFVLTWADRIPYDLYLALMVIAGGFSLSGTAVAFETLWLRDLGQASEQALASFAAATLALTFALLNALLMSTAARFKARTLLRNTLIARLLRRLGSLWSLLLSILGSINVTYRTVVLFLAYLVLNAFLAAGLFLSYESGFYFLSLLGVNTVVLGLMCRYTLQWSRVRAGASAIVGGEPDTVIDTEGMDWFPSLRSHAEALNDLGTAVNTAVEERMKSERMKAELITNVSHDLKTPLTSIINYVDLLKKEDIQGEKALEYLEVLDRKSQRLKKLTEDLVEASKASTGALAVTPERLGFSQLVEQALGEYDHRLVSAGLTPVLSLPDSEVYVLADGRHVWRILDNLMGNCVKYALPGTRIYLDVTSGNGFVSLSIKNISAQQLNIDADALMERFVRGDESRTTEGSGLGLSIARSLCELQGGQFRLEVDGDLFKAVVSLPQIP